MNTGWHYPHDLFELLVDTIPRLCRSKWDLILFLRGAAVPESYYTDLADQVRRDKESINKFDIIRRVLQRLNDSESNRALKARRDIIQRVIDFEDFSSCWDNDRLVAQGLVEQIRKRVNAHDAFARMEREYERERKQRQAESAERLRAIQHRKETFEAIRSDLVALFSETNPHRRGKKLEDVLNRLFRASGILVREAFAVTQAGVGVVEQVDGAVDIGGRIYLVEMKWWNKPVGTDEIAPHLVRVYSRPDAHGICISASNYTEPAIATCREGLRERVIVLCMLEEIVLALEQEKDIAALFIAKITAAITHKNPFHEPLRTGEL